MIVKDTVENTALNSLANLCADHLRHEEFLLEAILPIVRGIQGTFTRPDFERRADETSQQVAKLIDAMTARRQKFRHDLAPWLCVEPRQVTLSRALDRLPPDAREPVAALASRVRSMVAEMVELNHSVAVHLRVHLDAFQRLIRDLTGTTEGSGRYGSRGQPESAAYRPLIQIHG